eukprot:4951893-Amphidinium_carterae.1
MGCENPRRTTPRSEFFVNGSPLYVARSTAVLTLLKQRTRGGVCGLLSGKARPRGNRILTTWS